MEYRGASVQREEDAQRFSIAARQSRSVTSKTAHCGDAKETARHTWPDTDCHSGTTYSCDGDGNETRSSSGAAISCNAQNQSTSITAPGGTAQAMTYTGIGQTRRIEEGTTSFSYDRLGLRAMTPGNTHTTTYLERDSSGNLTDEWSSTGGTDFYLTDGLGSVIGLVDGNGNLVNSYAYHPYGAALGTPTQGVANPMQFAGYYNDSPTALYQVGARYYDPSAQRWTQQDLLTQQPGSTQNAASQYTYVGDDPINVADPSGRCNPWALGFGAFESLEGVLWFAAGFGLLEFGVVPGLIAWAYSGLNIFLGVQEIRHAC